MFLLHGHLATVWEDWGEIIRLHDPGDYSGTASHFLEAMLETAVGIGAWARLYNITTGEAVPGSVVGTNSAIAVRKRSPAFSLPAGDNEYKVQIGRSA